MSIKPNADEDFHSLSNSMMLGMKALKLQLFDDDRRQLSDATGFMIAEDNRLFLYTCWHVVSGVDPSNVRPKDAPKRRRYLKIHSVNVVSQPGMTSFGDNFEFEIDLYPDGSTPLWLQDPDAVDAPDLKAIGITVPKFIDVVRIPMDGFPNVDLAFEEPDLSHQLIQAGNDVILIGYPYAYSVMGSSSPEPVFLKRTVASNRHPIAATQLLDGAGFKCMSGSPVCIFYQNRYWLYGIYNGIIYPDNPTGENPRPNELASLGKITNLVIARAYMGVQKFN